MALNLQRMLKHTMWPSAESGPQVQTDSVAIRALITGHQELAWDFSKLGGRDDAAFWMSGNYVPPPDFEQARSVELKVLGHKFEGPIVSPNPITGPLQEKFSPPFILAAWNSILKRTRSQIAHKLGHSLFFATAPTNQLFPSLLKLHRHDRYVVVFDALFPMYFRGIVASVLNVLYEAGADPEPEQQWIPNWDPCFKFARDAPPILRDHPDQYWPAPTE